jgi:hypothetical protein
MEMCFELAIKNNSLKLKLKLSIFYPGKAYTINYVKDLNKNPQKHHQKFYLKYQKRKNLK